MSGIANPTYGLTLGSISLIDTGNHSAGYWFEALGDDSTMGSPVPAETVIETFLQNGSVVNLDSYGNREMSFKVVVCGPTTDALAQGENALFSQLGKRNTLVYTPPEVGGGGTPCVFDVMSSHWDPDFDDVLEMNALQRVYGVTLQTLPFARSLTLKSVTSPAPSSTSSTTTLVDACTSTTGWTGTPNAVSTSGGSVLTSDTSFAPATRAYLVQLNRAGSIATTTTPYIRIDARVTNGTTVTFPRDVFLNGTKVAPTAQNGFVGWFASPGSSVTTIQIDDDGVAGSGVSSVGLAVADISRSTLPFDGTQGQRQTYRSLAVVGSAPTEGSLALLDATPASLGPTLVYTVPNAAASVQPPLRTWLTSGPSPTSDVTRVSGAYSDLGTNHIFDLPASQVRPGNYLLVAFLKSTFPGTFNVTYSGKSRMGSVNDPAAQGGVQPVVLAANTWTFAPIGGFKLPTGKVGSAGLVRIEMSGPAGLLLDEAWIFNMTDGDLTILDAGTGTPGAGGPANRVWLDAPNADTPVQVLSAGTAADRSDSRGFGLSPQSFDEHEFVPPLMNCFTVTANSIATSVTLSHYPRYFTYVVDE